MLKRWMIPVKHFQRGHSMQRLKEVILIKYINVNPRNIQEISMLPLNSLILLCCSNTMFEKLFLVQRKKILIQKNSISLLLLKNIHIFIICLLTMQHFLLFSISLTQINTLCLSSLHTSLNLRFVQNYYVISLWIKF